MSSDPVKYAIKWSIAMIIVATIGIFGLSMYINATATGADEMTNASGAVILIVGTVVVLLACVGLALAFMPPELKSKIGMWCSPYVKNNAKAKAVLAQWC